eukprot:maker-scaffold_51-snap-gene-1.64-mRNA-1 protein AED:0.00 eAED:0.00 QI:26/1/1/1/1/1/2/326/423
MKKDLIVIFDIDLTLLHAEDVEKCTGQELNDDSLYTINFSFNKRDWCYKVKVRPGVEKMLQTLENYPNVLKMVYTAGKEPYLESLFQSIPIFRNHFDRKFCFSKERLMSSLNHHKKYIARYIETNNWPVKDLDDIYHTVRYYSKIGKIEVENFADRVVILDDSPFDWEVKFRGELLEDCLILVKRYIHFSSDMSKKDKGVYFRDVPAYKDIPCTFDKTRFKNEDEYLFNTYTYLIERILTELKSNPNTKVKKVLDAEREAVGSHLKISLSGISWNKNSAQSSFINMAKKFSFGCNTENELRYSSILVTNNVSEKEVEAKFPRDAIQVRNEELKLLEGFHILNPMWMLNSIFSWCEEEIQPYLITLTEPVVSPEVKLPELAFLEANEKERRVGERARFLITSPGFLKEVAHVTFREEIELYSPA